MNVTKTKFRRKGDFYWMIQLGNFFFWQSELELNYEMLYRFQYIKNYCIRVYQSRPGWWITTLRLPCPPLRPLQPPQFPPQPLPTTPLWLDSSIPLRLLGWVFICTFRTHMSFLAIRHHRNRRKDRPKTPSSSLSALEAVVICLIICSWGPASFSPFGQMVMG